MYSYPNLKPESVVVSTAATDYPVTLDDAKLHARVSGSDEDTEIQILLETAVEYVQQYQWSQLLSATHVMRLDRFPGGTIFLWPNPVQSITSLQYVDVGGMTQTLTVTTDYVTDIYSKPARIVPPYTKLYWPATRCHINDVTLTYVTGYGATADTVPANIRQAILLLIGHWYRNREATGTAAGEIQFAVKTLLDLNSYRTFY